MASISNDPNGRRRILFIAPDGARKTIRLGKCDRKSAESICRHIEALLAAKIGGQPVPRDTAAWLASVGDLLRDKLAAVDLVDAPKRATLGEFLRSYVLNRPDVKSSTLEVWQQPVRNLVTFFSDDKPLRDITAGDAEQFGQWLRTQNLAAATVAKRLSFARTFLHVARKHKLVDENPFAEVKIPAVDVSKRQAFVERDVIDKLLAVANPTWKTIVTLSRFGGLRCPSEVLSLEWEHIDWKAGRITVPSPKTDRYDGKESRVIPLFPELRTHLAAALTAAEPGQKYVVGGKMGDGYRAAATKTPGQWINANLRTSFGRLLTRAGVAPWPRLFHNLRSSRETELLEQFPVQVVSAWMGHDAKVCLKHYAQTTEDHFKRAAGGAESGARVAQNPAQQSVVASCEDSHPSGANHDGINSSAKTCDSLPFTAQTISGEGGKRGNG